MSSNLVRHAVVTGPRTIEILTRPQQALEPGQVRIAVKQCGVSTSDLRLWSGETQEPLPAEIGHEFAGEVIEVARGVDNVRVGARVAACAPSARGFADEAVVEARHCFPVDDRVPLPFAAEPLGRVWNAVQLAAVGRGANTVIVGAGFPGMLAAMVVDSPASMVVASRREQAREVAQQLGATYGVHPEDLHAAVEAITRGTGADVAYEFTGAQAGLDQAARIVRRGGKFVIGGFHQGPAFSDPRIVLDAGQRVLDLELLNGKAIDIVNAVRFYDDRVRERGLARALEFLNSGVVDPALLSRLSLTRDDAPNSLARAVNVIQRAGHNPNAVTVIVGARPGALLATRLISAKLDPGALIVATRRRDMRELAKRLGASHAVDPSTLPGLVDQLTNKHGADFAYDFTGAQDGLTLASRTVRMSGKLVLAAQHDAPLPDPRWTLRPGERVLDLAVLNAQDVEIVNGHFGEEPVILNGMGNAVRLLNTGQVDPTPLMGPSFSLEDTAAAFHAASQGAGKVVVMP